MVLDLSDDEAAALAQLLRRTINDDLSPWLAPLKAQRISPQQWIEKRLDRIEELLKQRAALGALLGLQPSAPTPAPANTRLSVTKWSAVFHPAEYRFAEYWRITYTLKNDYAKTAKLIDGALEFSDLFGARIYGVRLLRDVKIDPSQEQTFSGNYNHSSGGDDQRLRLMSHEDVKVVLRVRLLMFGDNTVLEFP
jgi:hypothetical protein